MMWYSREVDCGLSSRRSRADAARGALLTLALAVTPLIAALGWAPAAQAATCEVPPAAPAIRGPGSAPAAPTAPVIQIEGEGPLPPAGGMLSPRDEGSRRGDQRWEGEDQATPIALPATPVAATPVATPDPLVRLTVELTAVSEALAECLSTGDAETTTLLAGERYLGQLFGGSTPLPRTEYITLASQLTPVPTRIVSLLDVAQPADDRAQAVVTQVVGNQLLRADWTFEHAPAEDRGPDENPWRLAGERQLPVPAPAGAAVIEVAIGDRSFTLDPTAVAGPDVVLRGDNQSAEDHEMLVLRLAPGYTTRDLLRASGPDLPQEVTYIGELPVKAGTARDLVLVDLEPGTYILVCLFPDAEGIPHLAQGMEAVFEVTG